MAVEFLIEMSSEVFKNCFLNQNSYLESLAYMTIMYVLISTLNCDNDIKLQIICKSAVYMSNRNRKLDDPEF